MKILDIWITAREIQQRAEHETTDLAKNRTDQNNNPLLDQLVIDSDQVLLFRTYFREGVAKVLDKCRAYTKFSSCYTGEDNADVTHRDEDFYVTLYMPDNFPLAMGTAVDRAAYNALLAFVLWRWFELKLPNEALIFQQRFRENLDDLISRLETRITPVRRPFRPI